MLGGKALAGTANAATPILSIAAPFNAAAAIPAGDVTVRDVAGLYIFDNTLIGITFTGAQVKAYLEKSAEYFKQITGTGPFAPAVVTNAVTPTAPNGTPDYNYDIMGGLDAPLTYDIDIAEANKNQDREDWHVDRQGTIGPAAPQSSDLYQQKKLGGGMDQ